MHACEGVRCEAFRAAHIERVPLGTRMHFYDHGCHTACVYSLCRYATPFDCNLFILFLSICVGLFRIPQYDTHVCVDSLEPIYHH